MHDRYFISSLLTTATIYFVFTGLLIAFVVFAGAAGVLVILAAVLLLLIYFYRGAKKFDRDGGVKRRS
jgi:hypothetical protein